MRFIIFGAVFQLLLGIFLIYGYYHFKFDSFLLIFTPVLVISAFLTVFNGWIVHKEKRRKKVIDTSWSDNWFRGRLAEKHRKLSPITLIGDIDFCLDDKENLLKNRTYLRDKINSFESDKREFIRQFEPLDNRTHYKKIYANYSTILTEYDDAITILSKTLAEIEQRISNSETQEINEKRGTPEFVKAEEKYIPPTQPNWE